MVGFRSTFILMLKLLAIVSIPYGIVEGYSITDNSAIAQSSTESSEGISIVENQKRRLISPLI